jgi:arylformamidase
MDFSVSIGHAVDLTQTIKNGVTACVGDRVSKVTRFKSLAKDGVNISVIAVGSHTGTHVDAPAHFVKAGKALDKLPVRGGIGR